MENTIVLLSAKLIIVVSRDSVVPPPLGHGCRVGHEEVELREHARGSLSSLSARPSCTKFSNNRGR